MIHNTPGCGIPDCGPSPYVFDIAYATKRNNNYRTAIWTGAYLQATLMCIPAGGDIGLEVHPDTDQFLRVECGTGISMMGPSEHCLNVRCPVRNDYAVFVPAGTWHNIINTGSCPLKLYSIYAPPHHPHGIVHVTKEQAEQEDK